MSKLTDALEVYKKAAEANPQLYRDGWECAMQCALNVIRQHEAPGETSVPPPGHPLQRLGARLTELLDDDQWNNIEPLLLEAWNRREPDILQAYSEYRAHGGKLDFTVWQEKGGL